MLVNDSVIEKMFIEPDKPGDPFEVSDADTMLNYLNPNAVTTNGATLFSKEGCPFCKKAKELLTENKIKFTDISGMRTQTLKSMGGKGTFPLVFVDGKMIGGTQELDAFIKDTY